MTKPKLNYVCLNCEQTFSQWFGRCPNCKEWNTLAEASRVPEAAIVSEREPAELTPISNLPDSKVERIKTGIEEFDRVLGGEDPGLVIGSVVLLGGNPGVGKSTLLLQVASRVDGAIYFSAEESLEQLKIRAQRLGLQKSQLKLSSERDLNKIISAISKENPRFVVIDSIQTIYDDIIAGTPGSLVQVRENCWRLQQFAKARGISILMVGHVTKEGTVAGPKTLEHLVDVVLYLEGEKRTGLRILRGEKNRFGPTEEVGIWQLSAKGFEPVADPGKLFASILTENIPGRALGITVEGTRAFVVEIQALVTKTSFGYPKRTAQGIDLNRLNILLAVLDNRLELPLHDHDVFVNVVGGFNIKDPGIDLAVSAAIVSSLTKKSLPDSLALFGEIGLLGEIRPAFDGERRQKEAKRLNYQTSLKMRSVKQLRELFTVQSERS